MSEFTLTGDQAIFTSVRSPMGEGYRIIAASKGLRPEEKQVITRFCPSHEGLCTNSTDETGDAVVTPAVSFYELPTGRLCVSISGTAGAEHTGRGGQRVYTHIAVFAAKEFPRLGFNPFVVARALVAQGRATPELKPPPVLPELTLTITDTTVPRSLQFPPVVASPCRKHVLNCMLGSRNVVLNIDGSWLETAELFLLGVPGPLRAKSSVAAGLKFSAGRCQRLNVLKDDNNVARNRSAGQPVEFVEPETPKGVETGGAWTAFVDRHWEKTEVSRLSARTNRPFPDTAPTARERLGKLYALIDDVVSIETQRLLTSVGEFLPHAKETQDAEVMNEFITAARRELDGRLRRSNWREAQSHWSALLALWRRDPAGRAFAAPLLGAMLRAASGADLPDACEAAAEWQRAARTGQPGESPDAAAVEDLLSRCAAWAEFASESDLPRLRRIDHLFAASRPHCPILDRIRKRREMLEKVMPGIAPR